MCQGEEYVRDEASFFLNCENSLADILGHVAEVGNIESTNCGITHAMRLVSICHVDAGGLLRVQYY